jgi:hypothetical protein
MARLARARIIRTQSSPLLVEMMHEGGTHAMPRAKASKRELINTGTDKRYVRRDPKGQFKESDDVSRSLSADRRRPAKTQSKAGQGDRGDRKR